MSARNPRTRGSILIVSALCCGAAFAEPPASPELPPALSQPPTAAEPNPAMPPPLPSAPTAANPVAATQNLAPAQAPLPKSVITVAEDPTPQFPRYASLQPRIDFWTRIFGQYSELQSVVHSAEYTHKVYAVLDFRGDAVTMNRFALGKWRSEEEERVKAQVERLLRSVHAKRHTPELLNADERRIFELYADIDDDSRFEKAMGTTRAQRGLQERTAAALATSGKYLPEMERIFRGYGLPTRLTRLPLVESSFNVEAYSKVGAAGLWQFMPASARMYMRLDNLVDDRRDPWTSTDAAARHLRDDYRVLGAWPLALTAYNHGRGGIARGLRETGGTTLPDLIRDYKSKSFGFASKNFYAEFIAASDVERNHQKHFGEVQRGAPVAFDVVETRHYVPYETLRRLCGADDELFRKLNPAYRPEVIEGKLYVPPGHLIRVPAGSAKSFDVAYSRLSGSERFDSQRVMFLLHRVKRGDSMGKLAKLYGVSQTSIARANGIKKNARLRPGQVLKVPPHAESRPGPVTVAIGESKPQQTREQKRAEQAEIAAEKKPSASKSKKKSKKADKVAPARKPQFRVHKVASGQTLSSIAARYDVSIAELRAANGLKKSSVIKAGQKLKVPN
ncbi:LysM peptidoglycan-binding domain-containing protein [Solimonas sp. K1W22B-7]|uniref:lytic transglycosylase domain-containing protein n=1 Tax=Solimonas sp. K1W22B-7 TaxID=2303331 RepID=UPI000E3320E1|nr:lytic transglycosylase domain-containing protein [Solimonas sp. K1W22B-7]AXQ31189.1 LysM peptidoglycan-binding domain-containing protein [Solimonas sp. K1W22B-7]